MGGNFVFLQTQVNPACRDEYGYTFDRFSRPFPDLDLESRSRISVYLSRGSLVKCSMWYVKNCFYLDNSVELFK
jgi:hypothetical protein